MPSSALTVVGREDAGAARLHAHLQGMVLSAGYE